MKPVLYKLRDMRASPPSPTVPTTCHQVRLGSRKTTLMCFQVLDSTYPSTAILARDGCLFYATSEDVRGGLRSRPAMLQFNLANFSTYPACLGA